MALRHLDDAAAALARLAALNAPGLRQRGQAFDVRIHGSSWGIDPRTWRDDPAAQLEDEGLLVTWARVTIAELGYSLTFAERSGGDVEATLHKVGVSGSRIFQQGECGLVVLLVATRKALEPPSTLTPRSAAGASRPRAL